MEITINLLQVNVDLHSVLAIILLYSMWKSLQVVQNKQNIWTNKCSGSAVTPPERNLTAIRNAKGGDSHENYQHVNTNLPDST